MSLCLSWPFLLSPEERRPWPFGLEVLFLRLWQAWAVQLGVEDLQDANQWRQRLFVLPPVDPQAQDWHSRGRRWVKRLGLRLIEAGMHGRERLIHSARSGRMDRAMTAAPAPWFPAQVFALVFVSFIALGFATTPLDWMQQLWLAGLVLVLSLFLRKYIGRMPTIILISFSILTTLRYLWWRVTASLDMDTGLETGLAIVLFLAELYAAVVLFLGFAQTIWPLRRKPLPLPVDSSQWPSVDVFIPTYDEPLDVVKPSVYAALGMDWPKDRLNVYLLDDGKRDSFREFAASVGVHYIRRPDNSHAKAGNLNYAMARSQSPFIVVFDCDHIPVRSFLQINMGWLLDDPQCALVQTPHHFFSPDPMERNLGTFHRVPNEGALFYGLIQDGNDLWNATYFCGSCAILRRKPLEEIGGIAVETVTEDAHTALKLHRLGYRSVYCGVPQAAGLATENLASHVRQRVRWARGMAQIFGTDNPNTGPGLSLLQRLCYTNSILHFMHGIPRIIFLCAPLVYLLFGLHIFSASAIMIAAFVVPHLLQGSLANAHSQSRFRHSFWGQVYESTLSWYIALPSTFALFGATAGKFNVTSKGGRVEQQYFDWKIAEPFVVFILLSLVGVIFGVIRLIWWNSHEPGTVLLNFIWAAYNLIVLGAAAGVAEEHRQVRRAHRVAVELPAVLYLPDGRTLKTRTLDFSLGGLRIDNVGVRDLPIGSPVQIGMMRGAQECCFAASLTHVGAGGQLSLKFEEMGPEQEKLFLQCSFGRADLWAVDEAQPVNDNPVGSFVEILGFGIKGYRRVWWYLSQALLHRLRSFRSTPDPAESAS